MIGQAAFYENNLTSVVIPTSVRSLKGWAFDANNMTSVEIGGSVDIVSSSIGGNFERVYKANKRAAGVYARRSVNSNWYRKR
ncbi:leucine-rich repeat domain-containing protein [Candidatus Bipolaricaulota bacterium]|nr:leucine-rich repeat domain-containing protein [Candidatus Bipolaricaulota bacterium]